MYHFYTVHQACMAHPVWHSENMELTLKEEKKHLKFNLHFGGKTYNAIQWWCTNKPSSKAWCILFDTFYLEIMYGQSVDILRIILEKGLLPAKKKY